VVKTIVFGPVFDHVDLPSQALAGIDALDHIAIGDATGIFLEVPAELGVVDVAAIGDRQRHQGFVETAVHIVGRRLDDLAKWHRLVGAQREALRAKEQEAEELRKQLKALTRPTIFVEGVHDVPLVEKSLERLGVDARVGVKPLGGTPSTTDALVSAVLQQGGLAPGAKTIFLFDDDKAGRNAAKKLAKTGAGAEPVPYGSNTFVCVLERSDDFKRFLKRRAISTDQAFFTAEFLFPVEQAANLCLELTKKVDPAKVEDWRRQIHGDYWPSVGQKVCSELMSAAEGSADWFYARGVPDFLKGNFAQQAVERGFDNSCRFPLRSDPVFPSRNDPGDGMSRRAGFGSSW
jgi:hypothetical protein